MPYYETPEAKALISTIHQIFALDKASKQKDFQLDTSNDQERKLLNKLLEHKHLVKKFYINEKNEKEIKGDERVIIYPQKEATHPLPQERYYYKDTGLVTVKPEVLQEILNWLNVSDD